MRPKLPRLGLKAAGQLLAGSVLAYGTAVNLCQAVEVGDGREAVLAELGAPQSKLVAGTREFLQYPQGRIVLTDGRVSEIRGVFNTPAAREPQTGITPAPLPATPTPPPPKTKARPQTARWITSLPEAQLAAKEEKKLILALFTGTDWCPPCQQFEAQVAHDEQFFGIFAGSFVFFKNNWLRNTPQPEAVQTEVDRVRRKYVIRSYPTLMVLNAEGEKLATVEWMRIQAGTLKECMIEAIDIARKATKGGKKVSEGWWPF